MAGGTRRTGEKRKGEILERALEILHEEGIHALSLRNIASRVGVSEAALFRHFRNKEDLMDGLADMIFAPEEERTFDDLRDLLISRVQGFEASPERTGLLFQEEVLREYPTVKARFDEHRRRTARTIAEMIGYKKRSGDIPGSVDADATALIVMGALRMLVLEWRASGYQGSLSGRAEPVIGQLVSFLEGGR